MTMLCAFSFEWRSSIRSKTYEKWMMVSRYLKDSVAAGKSALAIDKSHFGGPEGGRTSETGSCRPSEA